VDEWRRTEVVGVAAQVIANLEARLEERGVLRGKVWKGRDRHLRVDVRRLISGTPATFALRYPETADA
jgi:hypothetical protein